MTHPEKGGGLGYLLITPTGIRGAACKISAEIISTFLPRKQQIGQLLSVVPGIGNEITRYAHKIDDAIKGVFIPGRLFEDLGFRYVGPIDGHDIKALIESFNMVKDLKGPTLMHVITRKGKGYEQAEEKADVWHGAKPFNISVGL